MLTTNAPELVEQVAVLRLHGISRDAWKRYQVAGYQHYEVLFPGYKYNMFDLQAALALPQLSHIDDWQRRRETYSKLYNRGFADIEGLPSWRRCFRLIGARCLFRASLSWRFSFAGP